MHKGRTYVYDKSCVGVDDKRCIRLDESCIRVVYVWVISVTYVDDNMDTCILGTMFTYIRKCKRMHISSVHVRANQIISPGTIEFICDNV